MTTVSLRIAGTGDSKLLSELGITCFTEAFGKYNSPEDLKIFLAGTYDEQKIFSELGDKIYTYIIAEDEKPEAIGYVKLSRKEIPEAIAGTSTIQIERIYVRQKIKGKKVGSLLMKKCIEIAQSENYHSIWLGVWQENKTAIDFYHKWGFENFGYKQFKIGNKVDDDFMMMKKI